MKQLLRFGVVGISGTLVNTLVLWLLIRWASLPIALASVLACELAILNNFVLNDQWTFRQQARHQHWPLRLLRFNGVSLGGLCITVGLVYTATTWGRIGIIPANLLASGVTMIWNYTINNRWTYRMHRAASSGRAVER